MSEKTTFSAQSSEIAEIARLEEVLNDTESCPTLNGMDGEKIKLPPSIYRVLQEAVHLLAAGNPVALIPEDHILTTQQAANMLNVSRQYLYTILESGKLPYFMVGTHKRIRLDELTKYKEEMQRSRRAALVELTSLSQEIGYEE